MCVRQEEHPETQVLILYGTVGKGVLHERLLGQVDCSLSRIWYSMYAIEHRLIDAEDVTAHGWHDALCAVVLSRLNAGERPHYGDAKAKQAHEARWADAAASQALFLTQRNTQPPAAIELRRQGDNRVPPHMKFQRGAKTCIEKKPHMGRKKD